MTAINIATQIPNSIVTLEQLVAWGILALARINPDVAVLETDVRAELAVQMGIFTDANNTQRLFGRVSIELDSVFTSDTTKKLWMHAKEFPKQTPIPATFTSN